MTHDRHSGGPRGSGTAAEAPPQSSVQRDFLDALARAAASDATVLLRGEPGTGKTRAARRLHAESARGGGPLVAIHLGSLSPTLIESELFGHVKGAFTGAVRDRAGAFRRAEGGTLVLDDVHLLPVALQTKLLRALQERTVEPVGAETPVPIDVRVCATTTADLARAVREGRFRDDLFYRLAVVVLDLPPLRARPEDLPELVHHTLQRVAVRLGRAPRTADDAVLERLARHAWPGNVRELENAMERVSALGDPGAPVDVAELAFLDEAVAGEERRIAKLALSAGVGVRDLEVAMLEEALEQQRGNVSAAARQVGVTRRAFEYRLARAQEPDEDAP
ncbi:MAG: sigma-54 dependent transcriptional regulator [Planctomycetota bacterium]